MKTFFIFQISLFLISPILFSQNVPINQKERKVANYRLDAYTLRLAKSLQQELNITDEVMCRVQLIFYDDMEANIRDLRNLPVDEAKKITKSQQEVTLNKVIELLSETQAKKFEPIKDFYINASQRVRRAQRRINKLDLMGREGKTIKLRPKDN
jgi:hypothetical protein